MLEMENVEKTWTVVRFQNEDTVEAVPTSWILGNTQCYWPPFTQEKILAAIRRHAEHSTCWPLHMINMFRNSTYNDYAIARRKARKAEETSDLNSDIELKRRRKKKMISSSESEISDGDYIRTPPKLIKTKTNSVRTNSGLTTDDLACSEPVEMTSQMEYAKDKPCLSLGDKNQTSNENKIGHFLKELLKQQHFIRGIVLDILEHVRVEKKFEEPNVSSQSIFNMFKFPIDGEELLGLEVFLKEEENFSKAVIQVAKVGGKNTLDFTRRALNMLIRNELASTYSWFGRKMKKCFKDLLVAKLIVSAAEKAIKNNNNRDTEACIQSWLRRATERRNKEELKKKSGAE